VYVSLDEARSHVNAVDSPPTSEVTYLPGHLMRIQRSREGGADFLPHIHVRLFQKADCVIKQIIILQSTAASELVVFVQISMSLPMYSPATAK
jgi:hypothetical protein